MGVTHNKFMFLCISCLFLLFYCFSFVKNCKIACFSQGCSGYGGFHRCFGGYHRAWAVV